jgi:hypothetical protein
VEGIVFGNWGEASEANHKLVDAMATSRARVAEPQTSRRGDRLTEESVRALAVGHIRNTLSVAAVQAQCNSLLLGRLASLVPGASTAAGRRRRTVDQERLWARERRTDALADRQGFNLVRRGFAKLN